VIDLVHPAEEVYGKAVGIDVVGPHMGELSAVVADITKGRLELGWSLRFDLSTGLAALKACDEYSPQPRPFSRWKRGRG
jgi:UDP-glucose 4-epimerase